MLPAQRATILEMWNALSTEVDGKKNDGVSGGVNGNGVKTKWTNGGHMNGVGRRHHHHSHHH